MKDTEKILLEMESLKNEIGNLKALILIMNNNNGVAFASASIPIQNSNQMVLHPIQPNGFFLCNNCLNCNNPINPQT